MSFHWSTRPVGPNLGVRAPVAGDLDVPGRVRLDQLFPDSQVQRRAQRGAQVVERRRRPRQALGVGGLDDLGEHGPQQRPVQIREPLVPEVGDEDQFDVAGVGQPGGRPYPGPGVEPVPQPPLHDPAATGAAGGAVGQAVLPSLPGGGPRGEPATTDPFGAAEQFRRGALEVPASWAVLGHQVSRLRLGFA